MEERNAWIDPHQRDRVASAREVGLHRAARLVGLIAAWLGIPVAFLTCGGYIQSDIPPGSVYMMVSMVLRFVVVWFAVRLPLAGGTLLIAGGVLSALLSQGRTPAGVLGVVLIPSGVLFLLTWVEGRKNANRGADSKPRVNS